MKHLTLSLACAATLASASFATQAADHDHSAEGSVPLTSVTKLNLPAPDKVSMLRLKSGQILWGEITEHTPDGITFARLDSGGLATLAWSFLDPTQEEELRLAYGYVDLSDDELMVDADRVVLDDGTEVIGKIIERTNESLILKTHASSSLPIPLRRVRASSTTVVPAAEIYTREELYFQELVRTDVSTAQGNYDLARFSERILDFEHAIQHYEEALRLDSEFRAAEIPNLLERARESAVLAEQLDYLAKIDLLKRRKKFDEALQMAEAFSGLYPSSPLQQKLVKRRDQVLKARDRLMIETVASRWHYFAGRLARKAAIELPFAEAQAYAAETLSEEVLLAVTDYVQRYAAEIQPEDVRKYWNERKKTRWRNITYGQGTWLLGEDAALKGLEAAPEEEPGGPQTEQAKQRAALAEKLRVFMENQQRRRQSRASGDEGEERDQWWTTSAQQDRERWILAYYIENSKDYDLNEKVLFRNCRDCGGTGVKEVIYTGDARSRDSGGGRGGRGGTQGSGSGSELQQCDTCKGISKTRRIQYR